MAFHDSYYTSSFRELAGFYRCKETPLQVEFVCKTLAMPPGSSLLDLACGFGRLSIPLAQSGFKVTGYDASADYLAEAGSAAATAGVAVDFHRLDMRQLDDKDRFDAVMSWSSSLAFYDEQTNRDIFRRVAAAVRPGGKFLFDQANLFRAVDKLVRGDQPKPRALSDGRLCHRTHFLDIARSVVGMRLVVTGPDGKGEETGWALQFYLLPELKHMLGGFGLSLLATYGDCDCPAYSLDSPRLISLWQKA